MIEGVLTRGRRWDKIFQIFWSNPIDLSKKDEMKRKKIDIIIKALKFNDVIIQQQISNKLEKESLAKIKINLDGDETKVGNEVENLSWSNIIEELENISDLIPGKRNKCKYFCTFES